MFRIVQWTSKFDKYGMLGVPDGLIVNRGVPCKKNKLNLNIYKAFINKQVTMSKIDKKQYTYAESESPLCTVDCNVRNLLCRELPYSLCQVEIFWRLPDHWMKEMKS